MYASNYFETLILNLMRSQNISVPSNLYVGLFLSNPGDSGTEGNEISYTGYERQEITFGTPVETGAGMMISNSAMITFPQSPSNAGTVNYIGVFDAQTNGNMYLYGALAQGLNVQNGVSPVFRAGNVSWIISGGISNYYKTAIMNVLRGSSGVAVSGFTPYIALYNGDPNGAGNEFSGNKYERFTVTMSTPTQQSSGVAMSQNTADVTSPVSTGNWGTLNYIAICDAETYGNVFASAALPSSYQVYNGYSVTIQAGNLQVNVN